MPNRISGTQLISPVTAAQLVAWPTVRPDTTLAEAATVMDRADAQWVVVDDPQNPGWLSRATGSADGIAADRAEPAAAVAVGDSLEKALAAILAGNAPGAIVTDGGRYAGVLLATDVVTAARSR